jgi:hypothetical protein
MGFSPLSQVAVAPPALMRATLADGGWRPRNIVAATALSGGFRESPGRAEGRTWADICGSAWRAQYPHFRSA